MGEELAEVVEFHRRENLRLAKRAKAEAADEGDVMTGPLRCGRRRSCLLCVFLVETAQQVAVCWSTTRGGRG